MTESKYLSKKVVVDGIEFDSKDESLYYVALKEMVANNEIRGFELQPKYTLIPSFKKDGKSYRAITYSPDFLITHLNGNLEAIDIKGFSTQQGEMRLKLFNYSYTTKLTWLARNLKYGDKYGFIDYFELKKVRAKNKKAKQSQLDVV